MIMLHKLKLDVINIKNTLPITKKHDNYECLNSCVIDLLVPDQGVSGLALFITTGEQLQ